MCALWESRHLGFLDPAVVSVRTPVALTAGVPTPSMRSTAAPRMPCHTRRPACARDLFFLMGNMGGAKRIGAGWKMGISGSGENGGYHRGGAGGDERGGEGDRERTERVNEPGLVGGVGDREERPRDRNA
jgi:hypothetical protein